MTNPSIPGLQSFSETMIESYVTESKKIGAAWLPVSVNPLNASNSSRDTKVLRHAVILHCRELVNVGTEKDWGSKGASTSDIVKRGAGCIRLVGESNRDMDLASLEKDGVFGPLSRLLSSSAVSEGRS
jgi:hypothetical protein